MRVFLDEAGPFGGEVFLGEDGGDGTFVDAEAAIDAGVGIDEEHLFSAECAFVFGGMNAIDGADRNACGVLHADAGLSNDVGHSPVIIAAAGKRDKEEDLGDADDGV